MHNATGSARTTAIDLSFISSTALKPGESSELHLRKFDRAPIKIVHRRDIPELAWTFLADVNSIPLVSPRHWQRHTPVQSDTSNVYVTAWQTPLRIPEQIYNDRLASTRNMINLIARIPNPDMVLAYYVDNHPVGALVLQRGARNAPATIPAFATHPLSQGAGAALIEQAVAQAVAWDKQGCLLQLKTLDSDSTKAYQAFGFVPESDLITWELKLTPQDSDKWSRQGGQWQLLNRDTNKKYIG